MDEETLTPCRELGGPIPLCKIYRVCVPCNSVLYVRSTYRVHYTTPQRDMQFRPERRCLCNMQSSSNRWTDLPTCLRRRPGAGAGFGAGEGF